MSKKVGNEVTKSMVLDRIEWRKKNTWGRGEGRSTLICLLKSHSHQPYSFGNKAWLLFLLLYSGRSKIKRRLTRISSPQYNKDEG